MEFFNKNQQKYKKDVLQAVFDYSRKYWILTWIIFLCRYILECSFPLLIKAILNWFELENSGGATMSEGYYYATMITVFVFVRSYCGNFSDYVIEIINTRVRSNIRVSNNFEC